MSDPVASQAVKNERTSLYGHDLLEFIAGYEQHRDSAFATADYVLTHAGRLPGELAIESLGFFDRAVFDTIKQFPAIPLNSGDNTGETVLVQPGDIFLTMYANTLGRLHIRLADAEKPAYDEDPYFEEIGQFSISAKQFELVSVRLNELKKIENLQFQKIKAATDLLQQNGELQAVLESVIDHVEHVESVCFYVGDRFFALIDRYVNLITTKGGPGYLSNLLDQPYESWEDDAVLIVAALHALFISGRSVRFEEFNGCVLSATSLWQKFDDLLTAYKQAGCEFERDEQTPIFTVAQIVRDQTFKAIDQSWLRYRWIYGLNFQKNERVLVDSTSDEDQLVYLREFRNEFHDITGKPTLPGVSETAFFTELASACLARDIAGTHCHYGSSACTGWIEFLMEKIVSSAVTATDSDYGMSSSFRNLACLLDADEATVVEAVHGLMPADFFTSFVSRGFGERFDAKTADMIATTVQKRMMFNRWHFIPGNLDRSLVSRKRHWYYPPLVPDIAVHSDMHRAAHSRAMVKFSIRAPGPDMGRPPLVIAGRNYRGFYDIRVVRMNGEEYSTEDMVRARRRTLWLEAVYGVVVDYLQRHPDCGFAIKGFAAGRYFDLQAGEVAAKVA